MPSPPTHHRLPAFGEDRKLHLLDFDTGRELTAYTGFNAPIVAVALSADGKLAACTCRDHGVRVFRIEK